jgi:hypothetical protein
MAAPWLQILQPRGLYSYLVYILIHYNLYCLYYIHDVILKKYYITLAILQYEAEQKLGE